MTNKKLFIIIFAILLVFGVLVVFVFDLNCIFKSIFSIPCPGCGLTRGFRALFRGDIISATNYNILTIPIFLFFVSTVIIFLIDLIKKNNIFERYLKIYTKKHIVTLIIVLVVITWIINIVHNI